MKHFLTAAVLLTASSSHPFGQWEFTPESTDPMGLPQPESVTTDQPGPLQGYGFQSPFNRTGAELSVICYDSASGSHPAIFFSLSAQILPGDNFQIVRWRFDEEPTEDLMMRGHSESTRVVDVDDSGAVIARMLDHEFVSIQIESEHWGSAIYGFDLTEFADAYRTTRCSR